MRKNLLKVLLAILVFVLFVPPVQANSYGNKERQTIRMFVFTATNPTGFVDPNHNDLEGSVQDFKKWLSRQKYTLVDDRNDADVSIEVVGRGFVPNGTRPTATQELTSNAGNPDYSAAVRVILSAGEYSTTINGVNMTGPLRQWEYAAGDAEIQIDKWIRSNYDKLLSLRKK